MLRYLFPSLVILLWAIPSQAQVPRDSLRYVVQMRSGDSFRGKLTGYTDSTVTVLTEFGPVTLRKSLVDRFIPVDGPYLNRPHHFLMPTASPNGPGGFISNYELGFFYAGFGLGYGATITAGMTTIPGIEISKQFFHAGAKFTLERNTEFELAVGASYSFFTLDYPYAHIYGVGTFPLGTGRYSAMVFYRASGRTEAPIALQAFSLDTTRFTVYYTGSIGAAIGFDAPAFGRDDMRWVGELWNNDLTRPQNTVSMIGVRVGNEYLSADFGVALFTAPFIVPVTSFSWRF